MTQRLADLGEFGLVARVAKRHSALPTEVLQGIGDDASVICQPDGTCLLVAIDTLVEGVHFLANRSAPQDIGYKGLASSLSDIAAMGGHPRHVYLTLSLPSSLEVSWVDHFFDGFDLLATQYAPLLGGDTTRTQGGITITTAVVGQAKRSEIKQRSAAKVGDFVCVTGYLGDSRAGLELLDSSCPIDHSIAAKQLIQTHLRPVPHVEEGIWLGRQSAVHAMIDVSDGLHSDLQRLVEASTVGFSIALDRLPLSPALVDTAAHYDWDASNIAASGGEDYVLLVTVDPQAYEIVSADFLACFSRPLWLIGQVTAKQAISYTDNGAKVSLQPLIFDHFLPPSVADSAKGT